MARLLVWASIVVCGWALVGCANERVATQVTHCEPNHDGDDIFCTRAFFYRRFPSIERQDHYRAYADDPLGIAHNPRTSESLHWQLTYGLYDPRTQTCWTIARDPQHPTAQERSWMAHEHCHRVEAIYGWDAAAPMWDALPQHLHTHPDVELRLRIWRHTHSS